MSNDNPFPESPEKDFLRRFHLLHTLADYHESVGRPLAYFGLPSAEMRDVALWRPLLGQVTAVERDTDVAIHMYRTAQKLGIREKTTIIEMQMMEMTKFLVMEDKDVQLSLSQLQSTVQKKINIVRSVAHDVINLDLCGGFLYHKRGVSENARVLQNLIGFQARQKTAFILIITFALRDMGKDDYTSFIVETLDHLESLNIETSQVKNFYTSEEVEAQPPNLRRIRFCLPVYLHKLAFDNFQVRSLGAWYYKTFYHTALYFDPRKGKSVLGKTWPPLDEFKELLRTSMIRLETDSCRQIVKINLPAPSLQ